MTINAIRPGAPYLPALVRLWHQHCAACGQPPDDGLILLPTRRAARELSHAFLTAAAGRALLLPRIVPLGALDEAPLALAGSLTLPPAIAAPHRLAVLAKLILAMGGANGAPTSTGPAWLLAADLASLMDEAERAEIDLGTGLAAAVEAAHAAHWQKTLDFLGIVTRAWPDYLAEHGLMNPVARQMRLMDPQATLWASHPPAQPVMAVAGGADIPAVRRLLATAATLSNGAVVIPGLDPDLRDDDAAALPHSHPQAGPAAIRHALGAASAEVVWHGETALTGRATLLSRALLPADQLDAWRQVFAPEADGLSQLPATDLREEALAIALALRDALETPGLRAALVTPDRALAARVACELDRFGIIADDSAGEPLAETPPAVLLRLLARAAATGLAPVPLLALLKHPLVGVGLAPEAARQQTRALEITCLRGAPPLAGLAGLRQRLDARATADGQPELFAFMAALEATLAPLARVMSAVALPPSDLFAALIISAEALAATDDTPGPARLWAQEEGEALATHLTEILEALPALPDDTPSGLPMLLDALLAGAVVRGRRAQRGRGDVTEHPRIAIWGLLEARLQDADLIILGGLSEDVWPAAADPGPWLSRPMRIRAGLLSPEWQIGQAAQDFWQACLAAPRVVLSHAARRARAPAVPSRWLTRLNAMLAGSQLPIHPALGWAKQIDHPARVVPTARPLPCPPVSHRPKRLSVTEIATLRDDPYQIYASRILHLRPLDPIGDIAHAAIFGIVVHAGLHALIKELGTTWPKDAGPRLMRHFTTALGLQSVRQDLLAWWQPRLAAIADWIDAREIAQRQTAPPPAAIGAELAGQWHLPDHDFTLSGRADRVERLADGRLRILDYKTGSVPGHSDVTGLAAPQLPLEAAMAEAGAFGPDWQGRTSSLTYWRLPGTREAGTVSDIAAEGLAEAASALLVGLVAGFADPARAYPPAGIALRPDQAMTPYQHLARAGEWGRPAEAAINDDPA